MKVYIVTELLYGEMSDVAAVFSTEDLAMDYCEKENEKAKTAPVYYEYQELELDKIEDK